MPQFSYRARNAQGGLVEGVLDCPDRAVAIRQIEQLRYVPVRIELVGSAPAPASKTQKNGAPAPVTKRDSIRNVGRADAEAENTAYPVIDFHRATRPSAQGGHDPRRRLVGVGKTTQAAARATNDSRPAPGACGRPQFFASPSRFSPRLPADLREPCRRGRSERRVAGNFTRAWSNI